MQVVNHIFSEEQLTYLRALPEVSAAFDKLSTRKVVYFSIPVGSDIKDALYESFGIDLTGVSKIPFRWIRGDTAPHIDRGQGHFDNTYLVYLTDGDGQFHLGEESYPILAGEGFSFSEGLSHSVDETNGTSRLLLGPMSESGFVVGTTIEADGATDTVYVQYADGILQYKINNGEWVELFLSTYVSNTNMDPANNILKVIFTTDIIVSNWSDNFLCGSDGIQFGSTSLNPDGTRRFITVADAPDYRGFIQNGTDGSTGYNHIYIYNLYIDATGTTTLNTGVNGAVSGWVCQGYFGNGAQNNYIVNCTSSGAITATAGGIVGAYAASGPGSKLYIYGCSSSGSIGEEAGGILAVYAGNNADISGNITCSQCFTTGTIGLNAGGIFGAYAGKKGVVSANKCYSTGSIGTSAGGIYGINAGDVSGSATASTCYSRGSIGTNGGGIFGEAAGSNLGNTTAVNCYSSGAIVTPGNGIFGSNKVNGSLFNCYAADNNWSKSTANTSLTGVPSTTVGTSWVNTIDGQPYELNAIGYSPYSTTIINSSSELIQTFSQSIQAGQTSSQAAILNTDPSGNEFTILQITGGDSGSYNTITINVGTGAISTSSETVPGAYTLTIRSLGSYNITTFQLTLLGASVATGTMDTTVSDTCCVTEKSLIGLPYEYINNIRTGGAMLSERNVNPAMKFVDYSQYVLYKMAQSSTQI